MDGQAPAAKSDNKGTPAESSAPQTVVRRGGGQTWEDPTLLEWGNAHRIFVGNLAGEVTDESLLKAFSKYPSVEKARVVRDKRTTKSKGFGFVSFTDADDYFQAAKEMNGKYIGSHPVLIKRSDANVKPVTKKEDQRGRNGKFNNKNNKGGKDKEKDALGPNTAGGVKKGKVEGKYKVLG
jgi:RNA recognition motif-containing protein